mgnify:CR=1 FL=1
MYEITTDVKKTWRILLADSGKTSNEIWESVGVFPQSGGRKINNETIKLKEFVSIANSLGYKIQLVKE